MVSATFDGMALVALRRAEVTVLTSAVELLMLVTFGLSAWLNFDQRVIAFTAQGAANSGSGTSPTRSPTACLPEVFP